MVAPSTARFFDDGFRERFPRRVHVQTTRARLRPDVAPVTAGRSPPYWAETEDAVVEERAPAVRIVRDTTYLRIAFWLVEEDLRRVALADSELLSAPAASAPALGVTLGPGSVFDRAEEKDGFARGAGSVDSTRGVLAYEGWLPAAAVGYVFTPGPNVLGRDDFGGYARLVSATSIRTRPGGGLVAARVSASEGMPLELDVAQKTAPTAQPWPEIKFQLGAVRVRGFVPSGALAPPEPDHGTGMRGHGYAASARKPPDSAPAHLAPGACFYDRVDGEVIGVLRDARLVILVGQGAPEAAWRPAYIDNAGIALDAWVRAADVLAPDAPAPADTKPQSLEAGHWGCRAP